MLNNLITQTREKMFEDAKLFGYTSEITVTTSQKLDKLLNFYYQKASNLKKNSDSTVRVNDSLLQNIEAVSLGYEKKLMPDLEHFLLIPSGKAEWFSLEAFKQTFSFIEEQYGRELVMLIGNMVPINCIFPSNIKSFEDSLLSLSEAYHSNHTNVTYKPYNVYTDDYRTFYLFCNTTIYPYTFNYGIIEGLAKTFNKRVTIDVMSKELGGEFIIRV